MAILTQVKFQNFLLTPRCLTEATKMNVEELKRQHELTAHLLVCSLYKRHDVAPLQAPTRPSASPSPQSTDSSKESFNSSRVVDPHVDNPEYDAAHSRAHLFAMKLVWEEAASRRNIRREEQEALTDLSLHWISVAPRKL